jgi:hypothetical protein
MVTDEKVIVKDHGRVEMKAVFASIVPGPVLL